MLILRHQHRIVLLLKLQKIHKRPSTLIHCLFLCLLNQRLILLLLFLMMVKPGSIGTKPKTELNHRVGDDFFSHGLIGLCHSRHHRRPNTALSLRHFTKHRIHAIHTVCNNTLLTTPVQVPIFLIGQTLTVLPIPGILIDRGQCRPIPGTRPGQQFIHIAPDNIIRFLHFLPIGTRPPKTGIIRQASQQELQRTSLVHRLMRKPLYIAHCIVPVILDIRTHMLYHLVLIQITVHTPAQQRLILCRQLPTLPAIRRQLTLSHVHHT